MKTPTCPRCKKERKPRLNGQIITELCSACLQELELEAKKLAGTNTDGEQKRLEELDTD